jgi:hypothetical protein
MSLQTAAEQLRKNTGKRTSSKNEQAKRISGKMNKKSRHCNMIRP